MKTTDEKLAHRWACDERTIRRWRKSRAPLSDPKRMRAWLSGRKHLPPGTVGLLERVRATFESKAATEEQKLVEGVAAALRRLEKMEASGFTAYQRATASGDAVSIKSSRESWLKILETLRKLDSELEQSRRDSGELIPREQMLRIVRDFGEAFYHGLACFHEAAPAIGSTKDFNEILSVLNAMGQACIAGAISHLKRPLKEPHPAWLMTALAGAARFREPGMDADLDKFIAGMGHLLSSVTAEALSKSNARRTAWKKFQSETDEALRSKIWREEVLPSEYAQT